MQIFVYVLYTGIYYEYFTPYPFVWENRFRSGMIFEIVVPKNIFVSYVTFNHTRKRR